MSDPGAKSVRIGTMELRTPREGRTTEAVAAWYTSYHLEPQTVDIRWNGYWVWIGPWEGIIQEEYYPSMFAGVAVGNQKKWPDKEKHGETVKVPAWQIYAYDFCRGLVAGTYSDRKNDLRATIDERLQVTATQHRLPDGRTHWAPRLDPDYKVYKNLEPWKEAA